jgi:plastocyanin
VGDTISFTNDDEFLHQIYVRSDRFQFESAEQTPGETIDVLFPVQGDFAVECEIHPKMHLAVTVK